MNNLMHFLGVTSVAVGFGSIVDSLTIQIIESYRSHAHDVTPLQIFTPNVNLARSRCGLHCVVCSAPGIGDYLQNSRTYCQNCANIRSHL